MTFLEASGIASLNFCGYYTEDEIEIEFPNEPGIYCIFLGKDLNGVRVAEMPLYLGKTKCLNHRFDDGHHAFKKCKGHIRDGQCLLFSYATVYSKDLDRVEAALIRGNRDVLPENDTGKDSFNYDNTIIEISGEAEGLKGGLVEKKIAEVKK